MRKLVESRPRSTDHPKPPRTAGRPDLRAIVKTSRGRRKHLAEGGVIGPRWSVATPDRLARLHEGLVTLRSIAAALRLRSEGYVSNLIRRCDREVAGDSRLLANLDATLAILHA
jgi:hypothetical protein